MRVRFLVLGLSLTLIGGAVKGGTADQRPYFASIKSDQAYMREGPSESNRIKWVYRRKGLPVEVLASYDVWRRVRDMDGEIGWIHTALLSRERTAMVMGKGDAAIRGSDGPDSQIVAEAKPGALGRLMTCGVFACRVKFDAVDGWIERSRLWGIHDGSEF